MRLNELVQLHALLDEVRDSLERHESLPPDAFARYDAQPVRPHHIHRTKPDHERAVRILHEEIGEAIPDAEPEPDAIPSRSAGSS